MGSSTMHGSRAASRADEIAARNRGIASRTKIGITWLTIGAVGPAIVIALALLWFGDFSAKVDWTLTMLIVGCVFGFSPAPANIS